MVQCAVLSAGGHYVIKEQATVTTHYSESSHDPPSRQLPVSRSHMPLGLGPSYMQVLGAQLSVLAESGNSDRGRVCGCFLN